RHAAERAVGGRATADQRAVANTPGALAERAARRCGGGDCAVAVQRRRADGSTGAGLRRLREALSEARALALGGQRRRIALRQSHVSGERMSAVGHPQDVAAVLHHTTAPPPATPPPATRPPSMIDASISTVPASVSTEPRPALKRS